MALPSVLSGARVLLIEDNPDVAGAVRTGLTANGVRIEHASTCAEGRRLLSIGKHFDAIVLDLTLPDGDGAEIADACRSNGSNIPIIMVTAKDTVDERIAGLSRGADDYLCKPFEVDELRARLDALLRRTRPNTRHILRYADMELDLLRRAVRRRGIQQQLSAREVDLLAYFMCHPDEVLTKGDILKDVWGEEAEQDSNVLHVYANYLRNKLEAGVHPRLIHTVRGVGYVLSQYPPEETQ